ncbi:hypothetical protein QCA50_005802 [Cerrena zonata]|uniref:Uncharacterized protein n=1 Tax=Cerrena zonata TaxID=2478898 RepID=A0AAW0GBA1_9APHY
MDMGIVEANLREMDKTIGGIKGLFSSSSTDSKESNQPNMSSDTDVKSPTTEAESDESTTPPEGPKAKDEKKEVPSFQFKMQHGEVFKAMFLRDGSDALGELVKQRQSRKPSWMTEWEEQSRLRQAKEESDASQKS